MDLNRFSKGIPPEFQSLLRTGVGFLPSLEQILTQSKTAITQKWPHYNIISLSDEGNHMAIELAVAGFKIDELKITLVNNVLEVTGNKETVARNYMYQGITNRSFERKFTVAEGIKVEGAALKDGILTITLFREIPQSEKPKLIQISE